MDDHNPENAPLIDRAGRPRSVATMPSFRKGKLPPNFGHTYPPEVMTPEEMYRLLDVIPSHRVGCRDRALIAVLWRTGLRISEALSLMPRDLHPDTGWIRVRTGKSPGTVGMDPWGWTQLDTWLAQRARLGIGENSPVFCVATGKTMGERWSPAGFRQGLKKYSSKAGITRRVHPHGFRHTLAAELVAEGVGLLDIQRQLRHTSLAHTAAYLTSIAPAETVNVMRRRAPAWADDEADSVAA